MAAPLFVDTSFVIALINLRDQHHAEAKQWAVELAGVPLIVTDAVLLEIGNALARGFKGKAVEIIEHFLSAPEVEMVRVTPRLFEEAFAMYKAYLDKEWSFVDCISFKVMESNGIRQALAFDNHFRQAGFGQPVV
ncbi:MAG: type II toxin-antitoxin system VapC family toxin [Candidatus Hydrogenedentes bacterium]|nr:type II toxin-antitoxin system VapC family toxin [Candidatus Hydrogenedentota bacterium]